MAFISLAAGDVDAESPVADDLTEQIKDNLDWLKSAISDGASASQDIDANLITASKPTGDGLHVISDGQIDGNLNVTGGLTVGNFTVLDTALLFFGF